MVPTFPKMSCGSSSAFNCCNSSNCVAFGKNCFAISAMRRFVALGYVVLGDMNLER